MSLNKKIVSILKRKKLKLAIAESCTGGIAIKVQLYSVNGASKSFFNWISYLLKCSLN
jgi:Uncharacterized protein (competence- and mitomycin-induced)